MENLRPITYGLTSDVKSIERIAGYRSVMEAYKNLAETKSGDAANIMENFKHEGAFTESILEATLAPLTNQILEAKANGKTEEVAFLEGQMDIMKSALEDTMSDMIAESFYSNNVTPFAALTMPYMYLSLIGNSGLKIVDNKPVKIPVVNRNITKRYIKVDGKKEFLPDALKDKVVLDKIKKRRGHMLKIEVAVKAATGAPAAGTAGSFSKVIDAAMIAAGVKTADVDLLNLIEQVTVTGVKAGAGAMTPVTPLVADKRKDGLFGGEVSDNAKPTANVHKIYGKFNFEKMELEHCSVDADMTVEFTVNVDNGSGANSLISGSEKVVDKFNIGVKINQIATVSEEYFYDKKAIENVDGSMEILANFLDISNAVMDSDIFDHLLANESPINDLFSDGGTTATPINLTPTAGAFSGTPQEYKHSILSEAMQDMCVDLSTSLNAPGMMKFFCHPSVAPTIYGDQMKIDSIGGVKLESAVRNLTLGSYAAQVITSERLEVGAKPKEKVLHATITPTVKHSPVNEIFIVPSQVSYSRRSPENQYLATISVSNRYELKSVFPIAAKRTFTV